MSPKIATAARLPFQEAIEFLRRKTSIPTERWTDIWQAQHAAAFVVAGAVKDALLADLRQSVQSALDNGETLEDFRKSFDEAVAKHGWAHTGGRNWRSRVIFETNLRTAYAAGRYEQLKAVEKSRPFWRYAHGGSKKPRPEHLAWDGLILRADDPWWQTHYPPNGWGCSCKVFAVGERELRKRGIDPEKLTDGKCVRIGADGKGTLGAIPFKGETYEWTSKDGTRRETLPRGVQPGWAYNVGKAGTDIRDRTTEVQRKMENATRPQPPEQPWRERLAEQLKARKDTSQDAGKIEKSDGEKVELTGIIEEVARKIPLKKLGFTDTEAVPDNNAIPAAAVGIINARLEAGGFKARVKTIVYNQKKGTTEGSLVVRPPLPDGSEDEVFDTLARTKRIEDTNISPEHIFETMGKADRVRRVSSIASQKTIQAAFEAAQKGQVTRFIGANGRRYIEVAIDGLEGKALFLIERDTEDETRVHWFPVSGAGVIVLSAQEREAMLKLKNKSEMFKRRLTDAEIVKIVGNEEMSRDALDGLRRKIKQVQDEFI
ncbi:MAG: hypothetical protein IKC51_01490 [Myxococcaceae bacterium]|nr:hypothetical protein [Myxococcaceae bacterium]